MRLKRAFVRQPDVDLSSALPSQYRSRLASKMQSHVQRWGGGMSCIKLIMINHVLSVEIARLTLEAAHGTSSPSILEANHRTPSSPHSPLPYIDGSSPASILYPLSAAVESLLSREEPRWSESGYLLSHAFSRVLHSATVLFQSTTDSNHFVARCSEYIVAKAISTADSTEYTTLKFLETKSPTVLVPKPHGVLAVGKVWYMFMSFIPGINLETIWPNLKESQKKTLSCDLNAMLLELREIPFERGKMLGGVACQGCKDTRRHRRTANAAIYTCEGLWDFMYGCARNKETVYGRFLRNQTFPPREQRIVFIHGDFRPANIMVQYNEGGHIQVTGLIDWEMSGFYPEDFECVKALNNLSPIDCSDWYLFLPECISPRKHLESWHADLVWDPYVA